VTSYGNAAIVRAKRHYLRAAATAAALSIAGFSSCNSSDRSNERQVAAAENEVYEVVVHEMVKSVKGPSRLVFDDTLLTELAPGADTKACEESARKTLRLENNTPPYNSFADKLYRSVNRDYDYSLRADAIQDFLTKSCTAGRLSQTFHTDLPKTFIAVRGVHFNYLIANDGSQSFEQLYPGAAGIISLSRVGFDSSLREAVVSTSFVCGMLCGSGQRYVLRKVRGRWQVVNGWTVWVS
jgi:hypothetical protein